MKKILAVILMSLICSCCRGPEQQSTVPTVVIADKQPKKKLSNDFAFSHYVLLETTEDNPIGEIRKLQLVGDRIYILDDHARSIAIFSRSGKYVGQLDKSGRASSEYVAISDFEVDRKGVVFILDRAQRKILKYAADGQYLGTINTVAAMAMKLLDNGLIALYTGNADNGGKRFNYICIDEAGGIRNEALPFAAEVAGYMYRPGTELPFFYLSGNELYMNSLSDDTIYKVSPADGSIRSYVAFDFGSYGRGEAADFMAKIKGREVSSPFYFYCWNDRFMTSYISSGKRYFVVATPTGELVRHGEMGVDRFGLPFHPISYLDTDDSGYLITLLQPLLIEICMRQCRERGLDPEILERLSSRTQMMNNPILCFYRPHAHEACDAEANEKK